MVLIMAHTPFIVPDLALDRNAELPLQKQVYRQITAATGRWSQRMKICSRIALSKPSSDPAFA
jgi:hypothetical protein